MNERAVSIYPDTQNGKPTGRWRVDLAEGRQRYVRSHDSHADALRDEETVRTVWARGETLQRPPVVARLPRVHSVASLTLEAKGLLWWGDQGEATNWAHVCTIGHIIGMTVPLDEVDTLAIDKVITELKHRQKSNAVINRYLSHFQALLLWAERHILMAGPVAEIGFAWLEEEEGRRSISVDEERRLKALLPENVWTLVAVAIETGCHLSELLALKPAQLSGNELTISLSQSASPRTVLMSSEAAGTLQSLLADGILPTLCAFSYWWGLATVAMRLHDDAGFVFHACHRTYAIRRFAATAALHGAGRGPQVWLDLAELYPPY